MAYQKLLPFLDLTSRLSICASARLPWANSLCTFTEGPHGLVLITSCHCLEVISDNIDTHKILKLWHEFYSVQETLIVFKDPIRINTTKAKVLG